MAVYFKMYAMEWLFLKQNATVVIFNIPQV